MLELIIAIFPGILAFIVYRYSHSEFRFKKALLYILLYTVVSNLCILIGLKLIGMQTFNLLEMSARFKIKWIALEFALSIWITWVIRNVRKTNPSEFKQIFRRLFPATLFLVVTYAIFTPSSLFLGNIREFSLRYIHIVPVILCMALLLFAIIYFVAFWLIREKSLPFYIALIFALTAGAYIQGNFLNNGLPILDGTLIDWKTYRTENIISSLLWILCFVIVFTATILQRQKSEKIVKYISYFLSAVQFVSLVALIIMNPLSDRASYGFTKEGEFTIGTEENVVIFVIDTLQESIMEEYLASDAYGKDGTLDDFTLFDNTVAGGAPTQLAMPLLLTGSEYNPSQPFGDYLTEAWNETSLYDELHQNGYDIRVFSSPIDVSGFQEGTFDNYTAIGNSWIDDLPAFGQSLYQVVNYLLMPQLLKQPFWTSTDTLLSHVKNTDYKLNDIYFHNDFVDAGETLQADYDKTFRLYHMNGLHPPYNMTEYFDRVWAFGVSELSVLHGDMKIIYAYIDAMKKSGVYDNSTIIITGDHGRHSYDNPESNPAFLIKLPGETHALVHNSAPIHFRNVSATIAGTFLKDYSAYGPSIYDITPESDVERLHTIDSSIIRRIDLQNYDEALSNSRLIISDNAGDLTAYQLWNPYEINRIDYSTGDLIDFTSPNQYAEQIDYRLYKENGAATASTELNICFHLENYNKEDLTFHFTYAGLYNDAQKIHIYAGGSHVDTITCSASDIGKEIAVTIPKDYIENDLLTLRMVFPNAVTPNQLDRSNPDTRVLSVRFESMYLN